MKIPKQSLTVTKAEAAARQTEAAIEALIRGDFDIAITPAGAAEGMLTRDDPHMFKYLRNSPRANHVERKEWIAALNLERDWLKHAGEPTSLSIECDHAAFMIARAASKLEHWTLRMDEFKQWLEKYVA